MGVAVLSEVDDNFPISSESSPLRREYAERIKAAWHKCREKAIAVGRALIEAREALPYGEFRAMVLRDMPFKPRQAYNFIEIAEDSRLTDVQHAAQLPISTRAQLACTRLTDSEFEAAVYHGVIRPDVTEREVAEFQRQITRPETVETGAAWNELAKKMHRPQAVAKYGSPSAPKGAGATTISELMYLLIERRHALGLSQAAVDDKIGWSEGMCSKYEILHHDEGRAPSIDAILEYAQGLKCGLVLVALDAR